MNDDDAMNRFPAAVLMGMYGHCLSLPLEVEKLVHMDARHQATREVLLHRAEQARQVEEDVNKKLTYLRMIESLQSGRPVWEECLYVYIGPLCRKGHYERDSRSDVYGGPDCIEFRR